MYKEDELLKSVEKTKNSLNTDRLDMSFGEIISMYDKGEFIIDPDFQRLFRWTIYKQSRFIESILLGIPIPPFFVAEDKNGRWELVDGLQRISTVLSFFNLLKNNSDKENKNGWTLERGDLIEELEGFTYNELPLKLQLNIKRAVCRIEIVKWNSQYDMRYELFNRLNTGGARLTDQEIRNCIFRGVSKEFNIFLTKTAKNEVFKKLIKPTEKQLEELYLDELVLRFCSLYKNEEKVRDNISNHMTEFMREAVKYPAKIPDYENIFIRTINIISPLGNKIFRGNKGGFSSSLYDCIFIGIAQNIDKYEKASTVSLQKKISQLKKSSDFREASGTASNSKARVIKRLKVAGDIFSKDLL